jgi:hypothetical protein
MKRKTNLFYLSGDESNFLTFSNYGESLTGNFLATNWKMFPSRFLCLYINNLCFYLLFSTKGNFFTSISRDKGKQKLLNICLCFPFFT